MLNKLINLHIMQKNQNSLVENKIKQNINRYI